MGEKNYVIPNTKDRTITSSGTTDTGEFGISLVDSAHIMSILRDQMYSDKVLAVLREYGANAWDAHRMVGKGDVPIKVTLPTHSDPSLSIRDFGPGLSKDEVFTVFTQYGASTKRDSDLAVGMLGIGSKSGFAYSDSFTVISFHGGVKWTYVAVLDASEKGRIDLLNEEPCGDETGLLIQMAVRPKDIGEFESKAKKLFKYFKPVPEINTEIPPLPPSQASLTKGVIYTGSNARYFDDDKKWQAVMGCVPYRIDLDQLIDSNGNKLAPKVIWELSGALFFDIGEVKISASREELRYTDSTKATIIAKFSEMIDEYVKQTIEGMTLNTLNPWEKRVRIQILHTLHLPVPPEWADIGAQLIELAGVKIPKTFTITQKKNAQVSFINVNTSTRLILKNDNAALGSFSLGPHDYLIRRVDGADWFSIREDLNKFCEKIGIEGIDIIDIGKVAKDSAYVPAIALDRLKGKAFRFIPPPTGKYRHGSLSGPYSPYWKPEAHEPAVGDVFVVIHKFKPSIWNFYAIWGNDELLAEVFGFEMPKLIGYRTTKKNPVDEKTVIGIPFEKWSDDKRAELHKNTEYLKYLKMCRESVQFGGKDINGPPLKAKNVMERFGDKHIISNVISKRLELKEYFKELATDKKKLRAFEKLAGGSTGLYEPRPELDSIKKTYKLLGDLHHDPIQTILEDKLTGHWITYINAIDNPRKET